MSEQKNFLLHCDELEQFNYPAACPFDLSRARRTVNSVSSMGLLENGTLARPDPATRAEMETFHDPAYLDVLERAGEEVFDDVSLEMGLGTPDCPIFKGLFEYAKWAAGASLTGMRMLLDGKADACFNPSGGYHHAGRRHSAGFCYVNDVVIACNEAVSRGKRVLFLDIDVHHGDGVQDAFYNSCAVKTVSMHESGKTLFPGTGFETELGSGAGLGCCVNVPLPVGTYDEAYMKAFRKIVLPEVDVFDPDIIVIEAGMDALAGDPLAHLNLTNNAHAHIIERMLEFGVPMLVTGGGGYHIQNTVRGWSLIWSVICGEHQDDLLLGLGGVMLQNTDWSAGLRDRILISDGGSRHVIDNEIDRVIDFHERRRV